MRIYKIILLTFFAVMVASCSDFLDKEPKQSIEAQDALTSSENVRLTLNSAYTFVRNAYGQQLFHGADLLADDGEIVFQGTYLQPREYLGRDLVSNSIWPRDAWQDLYKGIYICNQVLSSLEIVSDDIKDQVEGEALFLRGLSYFDLGRFYAAPYQAGQANGQDAVPLMDESNLDEVYPSRASLDAVMAQVEADLVRAKSLLATDETFFASRYAACAILSRLYLMQERWAEAASEASEVIESGMFDLEATPLAAFNHDSNSAEDVFMFQQNNDDNLGTEQGTGNEGMSAFYASTNVTGRSDFTITQKTLDLYEPGDLRGVLQTGLLEGVSDEADINSMFYNGFGPSHRDANFCAKWLSFDYNMTFVRLAEMYLTRAEANFENGSSIGDTPLNDVKAVRNRAGIGTDEPITLEFIREERVRELIFEGHRLHDYKRWKWSVGEYSYNSTKLVFPIPQRETDVNENLTQNDGY